MNSAPDRLFAATAAKFPDGRFVVALSGGPDSAVLAWLASQLEDPKRGRAVFVHHGWPESSELQRAAQAVAGVVDLPLETIEVDVTTSEGDARVVRLEALERAAAGDAIVTGHHADDLAETALLNLIRGAGAAGIAGIPFRRGPYVRPLLAVRRDTIREAAEALGLPFVDDPANQALEHARNVIRADVVPRLSGVSPGAVEGIVRSAALAAADDALIEAAAASVPLRSEWGAISLPAAAIRALPAAVTSRVIRRALRRLRPPYAGDLRQVETVMAAADGSAADLGGGLRVVREGALITVYDTEASVQAPPAVDLPVSGSVEFAHHVIEAQFVPRPPMAVRGRHTNLVDAALADELVVRVPSPGDRIDIGAGHKLISDALGEQHVPLRLRPAWPVVVRHGKIVWIAGVRLAAWARPSRDADRAIQLTIERRGCSRM